MSSENQEAISIEENIANPSATIEKPPFTLEKKAYLFNQFYFDLLKKVKASAKQKKEKSKEARNVLRAIKNAYSSYETGSVEYIETFKKTLNNDFWKSYYDHPLEGIDKFLLSEAAFGAYVYNQISLDMIAVCFDDTFVIHHYLTIFAILMEDITEEDASQAMKVLKNLKNKDVVSEFETITNHEIRRWVERLYSVYSLQLSGIFGNSMSDIENTSIGKMAKEIMEEVDLSGIQNSISNNGDILKVLTDPNSGIGNLLGTVSQKMISKLATGELSQENLLQDAMKFASKLPSLMPGGGSEGGMDFGKISSMMQNLMGGQEDADGMGSLMNMMQGMMGGGGNRMKRSMANNPQSSGMYSAAKTMSNSARKSAQLKKLREKIKKQTSKENNIPDQVE